MNKKTALLPVLPMLFLLVACDSSDKKGGYRPPSGHSESDTPPADITVKKERGQMTPPSNGKQAWEHHFRSDDSKMERSP
jgi:hypothetical protein